MDSFSVSDDHETPVDNTGLRTRHFSWELPKQTRLVEEAGYTHVADICREAGSGCDELCCEHSPSPRYLAWKMMLLKGGQE